MRKVVGAGSELRLRSWPCRRVRVQIRDEWRPSAQAEGCGHDGKSQVARQVESGSGRLGGMAAALRSPDPNAQDRHEGAVLRLVVSEANRGGNELMFFVPGFLISILTFPGVIVHEAAHAFFCRM